MNQGRRLNPRITLRILACLVALASACEETPVARDMPIGTGGAGGMLSGGMGGIGGGGVGGGGMAGLGGMGGMGGVAGMVASGGMGGMTGGTGGMTGGTGGMTGGMGGSGGSAPIGDLCERWNHAHLLDEPPWNGNAASCEPGTMSAEALAQAHELHSLYREMAGLEPVEMTDEGNALAQECALVMKANTQITHNPGTDWDCYTKDRADTAATSSVSSGGALSSVDGYMVDPGNSTTIGHRRWILSNMLESVGFGSTGDYSCQYQPAQRPPAGSPAWIAWPPPGQVPIQSFSSFFANMDQTGWSLQSDTLDLDGADVTVTANGEDLPVTVTALLPGYGSSSAIRFNPQGWSTEAGTTYSVSVSGVSMAIAYEVEVIDCP